MDVDYPYGLPLRSEPPQNSLNKSIEISLMGCLIITHAGEISSVTSCKCKTGILNTSQKCLKTVFSDAYGKKKEALSFLSWFKLAMEDVFLGYLVSVIPLSKL